MRRRLVGTTVLVFALLALCTGSSAAAGKSERFEPVRTTAKAFLFKPQGVAKKRVRGGQVTMRRRGRAARPLRRKLSRRAARRAVQRKRLRVKRPRRSTAATLRVKLRRTRDASLDLAANPRCAPALQTLSAPGCELLFGDTAALADPVPLWGSIDCQSAQRHSLVAGGDPYPTATGAAQPDASARRLTVFNGDNYYGRRCELGRNDHRDGPTALYHEGERRLTFISLRLTDSVPLDSKHWQTVMQMKQSQPSAAGGGAPILELQAYGGRFRLLNDWRELWSAPAANGSWVRFAFDVTYSHDPALGRITVFADFDGNGDAAGAGEQSPTFAVPTLRTEAPGRPPDDDGGDGDGDDDGDDDGSEDGDGIEPGEAIPSHLRAGIYHHPSTPCQQGCSVDVDNVQVLAAD